MIALAPLGSQRQPGLIRTSCNTTAEASTLEGVVRQTDRAGKRVLLNRVCKD